MKAKVLIWRAANGGTAEAVLNEWLSQNTDKKIVRVTQSESGTVTANYRITYTVFYD